jgi:hypothetical protein
MPLAEGIENAVDLPHTLTLAITYRARLNSFWELPKDKQPPRNLWDKPWRLSQFFDEVFDSKGGAKKQTTYVEYDIEDVE